MSVAPPVRPRTELLPLDQLDEYRFQEFCTDLAAHVVKGSNPYQYGRRGDNQRGIDIVVPTDDGTTWALQCRRVKTFTVSDAKDLIANATYEADRYVIVLSCEASAAVRDEVALHPNWQVWDVRDVSRRVRDLTRPVAWRIVATHFGPSWPDQFLVGGPESLLLTVEEFFGDLLDSRRLFHHAWRMVGRTSAIAEFDAFARSEGERVAVLLGRGGIGKSQLTRTFASRPDGPRSVRFLSAHARFDASMLRSELAASALVIVDDAHRRDDLDAVLTAFRHLGDVKVILTARPWSRDGVLSAISRADFDASQLREIAPLSALRRDELEDLAAQALGGRAEYVDALVAVGGDSPLVMVVGGRLIAEGKVDPALMGRHEDFRRTVLARLAEDLIRPIAARIGEGHARALVDLVSAIGPIRPADRRVVEAAGSFLGIDSATFVTAVGLLEEGGILLRRGGLVQITPDVLSDDVLHRACVTAAGDATGYAERVFDAFADLTADTILVNLAELDWRQSQTSGADVFSAIWPRLIERLLAADGWRRRDLVKQLAQISYFQSARTTEFVETALAAVEGDAKRIADDIRVGLPAVLRGASYSLEHLPRALDALWALGRDDARPTNQHPDHAIRILEDVAGYGRRKPLAVGWAVVEAVRRWLGAPDAFDHAHTPLDVLDPLLEKSGYETSADGPTIHMTSFVIDEKKVRKLRDEAIAVLAEIARRDDARVLLRVIQSVRDALHDPVGYLGQSVTDEVRAQWRAEQLRLLNLLAGLRGQEPLADLRIRDAIDWHCRHGEDGPVRRRAREIAVGFAETHAVRLALVLTTSWDFELLLPLDEDPAQHFEEGQRLMRQLQERVAHELVELHAEPRAGAEALAATVARLESLGAKTDAGGMLFVALSSVETEYAARICEQLIARPDHPLSAYLAGLIDGVVERDPERATVLVRKMIEVDNTTALASVAGSLSSLGWRRAPAIWEIAEALAAHHDVHVRYRLTFTLYWLRELDEARAARLLASIDYGGNEKLADQVVELIGAKKITLSAFSDEELDDLVERLEPLNSLGEYWIQQFLDDVAARRPASVARLFVRRTALADTKGPDYDPVPWGHQRPNLAALEGTDGHADVLREVRDDMLRPASKRKWNTAELFATLSVGYGPTSLSVLQEWIDSGDAERLVAATSLLKDARWDFVFSHETFVVNLLERAHAIGLECYRRAGGILSGIAASGTWEGSPGEPAPRHVEQRDRADQAARKYEAGSPARRFYDAVKDSAIAQIAEELRRDEEEFAT